MDKPNSSRKKPKYVPKALPEDLGSDLHKVRYNRIKAALNEQGITNKELANRLGVTEGTVSTWCRNFKQPKMETLFEIAKAIGVEPSTLVNTIGKAGA